MPPVKSTQTIDCDRIGVMFFQNVFHPQIHGRGSDKSFVRYIDDFQSVLFPAVGDLAAFVLIRVLPSVVHLRERDAFHGGYSKSVRRVRILDFEPPESFDCFNLSTHSSVDIVFRGSSLQERSPGLGVRAIRTLRVAATKSLREPPFFTRAKTFHRFRDGLPFLTTPRILR